MSKHGNVWYVRHLEKGTDQYGCLQMLSILEKQASLGVVAHVCDPRTWEVEGNKIQGKPQLHRV